MVENKLDKLNLFFKITTVLIIICIAYILGYPSGKRLMLIGVLVIIFGYWWKWYVYWNLKASPYIVEQVIEFKKKIEENENLNLKEKIFKFYMESGDILLKICLYAGIALALAGYLVLLIKG